MSFVDLMVRDEVDESSMTGKSEQVDVNRAQNPFLFSCTKVANGYAKILAIFIEINMMWVEMLSSISRKLSEEMPLQACLNKFTTYIEKIRLILATVMFV
ncbi:hypothetical protein ACLOJK_007493, partial [Asimina triloba]